MAQQRMALWAAEDAIDDDIEINLVVQQQPQLYEDAPDDHQHAIPDVFIVHFHQAVLDNNLQEISIAYESGWTRLTEKFYAKTEWPEAELIAPLVDDDQIFLILYRELYYRHVYSRLQPNIDDRFHSYENSCELFNYLLNSDGPVPLDLPEQWLWDIIDEFIYQFQSFCVWRSKVRSKSDDELAMLADGVQAWSSYSVLNVLYSLIQKSRINERLLALKEGKSAEEIDELVGEYGARPLYRMLGYFSIVGLLRVHVLLGDFTLALKVMENVELNQKAPFTRVTACHVATYYYVGFCYIMLTRFPDAIRSFVTILNFILRMRQYHTRSYQYDQINKTADRMYALFALCHALSPTRLDDNILNIVREKYGEQLGKMARGDEGLAAFEELFLYACPKFISANPPPYEDPALLALLLSSTSPAPVPPSTTSSPTSPTATPLGATPPETGANANTSPLDRDPAHRHLAPLLALFRALSPAVPTLRSFLRLYTSLDAAKLAGYLDEREEEMVQRLMVVKMAGRGVVRGPGGEGRDVEGEKGVGKAIG
ncbi:hypothetical protein BV22DRAFT_1194288, partial [Leucogyrophana mollusca]